VVLEALILASNYLKALQLTKQLEKKAQEATHNRKLADEEIAAAEEVIKAAKKMDANIAKAEAKLTEATSAFAKKEFKSALELATESKNLAIKAQEDHVLMVLESTKNLVKLAKNIGIKAPDLEKILTKSDEAVSQGNYEEALKHAEKGWEGIDKLLNEKVSEAFTKAQSMIVLAKKVGQDVSEVESLLDKAREHTEKNDYENSLKFIQECMRLTGRMAKDEVTKLIENAMIMIELAKRMGVDFKKAEDLYNNAKTALEAGEHEKAIDLVNKSISDIEKIVEKESNDLLGQCEEGIKLAKGINAEVTKATLLFNKAKESFKSNAY
jgi:tetratricopeptide (TPR) repeat protein